MRIPDACLPTRRLGICSPPSTPPTLPAAPAPATLAPQVLLRYPPDAKEVSWQNGQPVQRPYRGPAQLRLEQSFEAGYDVRLAVTSWARAHFEVLHSGYSLDPGGAGREGLGARGVVGRGGGWSEAGGRGWRRGGL